MIYYIKHKFIISLYILHNWRIKSVKKILKWVMIVFVALILITMFTPDSDISTPSGNIPSDSGSTPQETPETPEVEAIKVSAEDLAKAYVDNEVKADKTYKDNIVEVTGEIKDIGVVFGKTYLVLSSGKDFSITDIQCYFSDQKEIDKIANLEKEQEITITGKVSGKSLNVSIKKCSIK